MVKMLMMMLYVVLLMEAAILHRCFVAASECQQCQTILNYNFTIIGPKNPRFELIVHKREIKERPKRHLKTRKMKIECSRQTRRTNKRTEIVTT